MLIKTISRLATVAMVTSMVSSLVSCAPGDDRELKGEFWQRSLDYSTCEQGPDVGEPVLHPEAAKLESQIVVPFKKPLYRQSLARVLSTSPFVTAQFMRESFDIKLYSAPGLNEETECKLFQELVRVPTGDIEAAWSQAQNDAGGALSGLYLHSEFLAPPYAIGERTIVVREDTSRWTLLHEFLHHLFNVERRKPDHYRPLAQVRESYTENLRRLGQLQGEYEKLATEQLAAQLANTYLDLTIDTIEDVTRNHLEEVAIEAMLIDLYSRRFLQFVPDRRASALGYLTQNKRAAEVYLNELSETLRFLKTDFLNRGYKNAFASLESSRKQIADLMTELAQVERKAHEQSSGVAAMATITVHESDHSAPATRHLAHSGHHDEAKMSETNNGSPIRLPSATFLNTVRALRQ